MPSVSGSLSSRRTTEKQVRPRVFALTNLTAPSGTAKAGGKGLSARELVKGRVLESSLLSSREACESLASACGAEPVQAIGNCFVLYKKNPDKKPEKKAGKKPAEKLAEKPSKKPGIRK